MNASQNCELRVSRRRRASTFIRSWKTSTKKTSSSRKSRGRRQLWRNVKPNTRRTMKSRSREMLTNRPWPRLARPGVAPSQAGRVTYRSRMSGQIQTHRQLLLNHSELKRIGSLYHRLNFYKRKILKYPDQKSPLSKPPASIDKSRSRTTPPLQIK